MMYLKETNNRAVELLCEGLQHPDCALETLCLNGDILTESNSKHIADVLRKNQRLRYLDMYLKNPDDKTMELLSDDHQKLKYIADLLWFIGDDVEELWDRHLGKVPRKNQRLRMLHLSLGNPDDKTMEFLCDGLKHPECTIATLGLGVDLLTESCGRHLAEVLRKNQRLRMLYLSLGNPDDKTMELLCDGLKHPDCTIATLGLCVDNLTESCSRHLAEVLGKNQRLGSLQLSLRNLDDKTIELLCDGVEHSKCTVNVHQ
ncbi:hypothetical protein E2320_021312 [Naja naja]|nr:hypothetical protein E2320_021312 [Naja naja]